MVFVFSVVRNMYVVILAGGKGERFWPLSTPDNPKPFLRFFSDRSLLQQTYDRARQLVSSERIFLVVGEPHAQLVRDQLPELQNDHILLEPEGRDTAAAIGYASLHLPAEAMMLVMPADHLIPDTDAFLNTVRQAAAFVDQHGGPLTFGIKPNRPEVNYGYIKASSHTFSESAIYPVEKFVEKPSSALAKEFISDPSYYWNSGIFLWKVERIRKLIENHLPELWAGLIKLQDPKGDFPGVYTALPRISIDFGVMQKAEGVAVIPAHFKWDDIGTWNALLRILPPDSEGNLVWGEHAGLETTNCILYSESHTMATAGIHDLVVVQSGNRILICSRAYTDRLKELLAKLSS